MLQAKWEDITVDEVKPGSVKKNQTQIRPAGDDVEMEADDQSSMVPRLASLLRPRLRGMCLRNHKKLMMKMMRLLEHTVGYVHETTMVIITVHDYFFGRSCAIMRSISETAGPDAFVLSTSRVLTSLALRASSPAFTISPHFTHISIRSSTGRCVHLGIKVDASLVFPAPRISL